MRVLIVDDSRTMRKILCAYAREQGFDTVEAEDGVEALDLLQDEVPFDAALIDWDMPRMDGLTLLKEVRADPQWDNMKVVMVTAQSDINCVAAALAAGADDYLMKPLDEDMFIEKLRLVGLVA